MNPGILLGAAAAALLLLRKKEAPRPGVDGQGGGQPPRPGKDRAVGSFGGPGTTTPPDDDHVSVAGVPGGDQEPGHAEGEIKQLPEPQSFEFQGSMLSTKRMTKVIGLVPRGMDSFVSIDFNMTLDRKPHDPHQDLRISRILRINGSGNDTDPGIPYDVVLKDDTLTQAPELFAHYAGEQVHLPGWNGEFFNIFNPKIKVWSGQLRLEYDELYVKGNSHYVLDVHVTFQYA